MRAGLRIDPGLLCPVKHRSAQAQADLMMIRARQPGKDAHKAGQRLAELRVSDKANSTRPKLVKWGFLPIIQVLTIVTV